MGRKIIFPTKFTGILLVLCMASVVRVHAVAVASVTLSGSTRTVESVAPSGSSTTKPYISRATLTAAESSAPLDFEVALKMRNLGELQARINRGEHVSATEMAAKYEPTAADYQAVVDWATAQGFTVVRSDHRHLALYLRGKVSHIATALNVTFSRVKFQGEEYTSAVNAPRVPSTISPLLIGINGLQPHLHPHRHMIKQQIHPDATIGSASYLPGQIATAYGATALYNADLTGGGQSIAIVIDTFPSTTDLLQFWQLAGINQSISNLVFIQAVVGTLSSPSGEETLDTEWASSMAPGAHVRVYAATDLANDHLDQAYQTVLDDATNHPEYGIHQMSMSFGEGETYTTNSQVQTDDALFLELANAGVTCFASSGDGGATPGSSGGGDRSGPTQVDSPASDPYVAGVGGTTLQLDANNNIASEVVWNNSTGASGGGASIYFSRPSWQTGTGVPTGTAREVPDIAAAADPNYGAVYYFGGVQDVIGGTSWASPTWAGFCALINQARLNAGQPVLGNLGPNLYPILAGSNYATDFRDITSGNNGQRFSTGSSAGTGYDAVTGLGSPQTQPLAQTLLGSATLIGVEMPDAMWSGQPGETASFSVGVASGSATYQWQRKAAGASAWSDVGNGGSYRGATSTALTIVNIAASMNGDQFRCVITLSGNVATTSTSGVLSVGRPLIVSTLAGSAGTSGAANATGTLASFSYPSGVACDASGNIYVADYLNHQIREVTSQGVVSAPYGSMSETSGHANGIGNSATFNNPNGVAIDGSGNIYVADTGNNLIRKITAGTVSTLAGTGGQFSLPDGLAVDGSGNVYVADTGHHVIRKVTPGGAVSTLAGIVGAQGYLDGAATGQALFNTPTGVAVDAAGNVYVADFGNFVIRKISPSTGLVTTVAGQATNCGYLDGPGATALFNGPSGVSIDSSGNLYVADAQIPPIGSNAAGNDLLRLVSPAGVVSTLAGDPGNEGSASGTGSAAQFYSLQAVAMNASGTIYLADTYNQLIRQGVISPPPTITVAATQPTAMVFGPTPGQFTVTRMGDTTHALTVSYSTDGTAVAGTDYQPLSDTLVVPSGSSTAVVPVTSIANTQAVQSPTLELVLRPASAYTVGNPGAATVSIEELTAFQSWKISAFGASATDPNVGGDSADPNHNGVPNLLEYAFGSNPLATGTEPLPALSTTTINSQNYLTLTYTQINNDPNLTCAVQVTSDLTQTTDTWHSGSTYTTLVSSVVNGSATQYVVRDNTPLTGSLKRFIRVQVSGQ